MGGRHHELSNLGAAGKPTHLNLSAAMHGLHANYMHIEDGGGESTHVRAQRAGLSHLSY